MRDPAKLVRVAMFAVLYYLLQTLISGGLAALLPPGGLTSLNLFLLAESIGRLVAALLAGTLLLRFMDQRSGSPSEVGLSLNHAWAIEFGFGLALGLAMMSAIAAVLLAAGRSSFHLEPQFVPWQWVLMGGLLLMAAAAEELIFRGYGFQRLVQAIGPAGAILSLSVLFGWMHRLNPGASLLSGANTMLVGILLALFYLHTRRLWVSIGLHWAWNFTQVSLGFPVSGIKIESMPLTAAVTGSPALTGGSYGPEASWLCTLVIAAGFLGLLWRPGRRADAL